MKKSLLPAFMLAFVTCCGIFAQNSPSKFGNVGKEELEQNVCPIDSNAHAYFIFNCGLSRFTYPQTHVRDNDAGENQGFVLETTKHFRIKILDESAFDWANIKIPLYVSGKKKEKLSSFKASTFNINNGKVEETKFNKGNLIFESTSENWETAKAPLPNVKKGSIIEVVYTVTSVFFYNLDKWNFQYSIPVLFSDFEVEIPEYFNFHQNIAGYYAIDRKTERKNESLDLTYHWQDFNGRYSNTQRINFNVDISEYTGRNIPAFKEDSYLKTPKNYLSAVEFELAYTKFPNSTLKYYTTSWENVIEQYLKYNDLENSIKVGFLDDMAKEINNKAKNPYSKIELAFYNIANHYKWNEKNSIFTSKGFKDSYTDATGNCADINLCLVGLLQKLGLEAYPVILSTQTNGFIKQTHPSLSDFNYLVALAKIDGNDYLMDATEPLSIINQLPVRCLNDKGLIVKKGQANWVDMVKDASYKSQIILTYELDENLEAKGTYSSILNNYAALEIRKNIKSYTSNDEYFKEIAKNNPGIETNEYQIEGLDSLNIPVQMKFDFSYNNAVEQAGDLIMLKPLLFEAMKQSPFKLSERTYPVEFNYQNKDKTTCQIKIPNGYAVESLPSSINLTLPDKSAQFLFLTSIKDDYILIVSNYTRNKLLYLPEEYEVLKEFFRNMVVKQNEKIVLKKL